MPPRYTYWTIILDGAPTAFRASRREELLPTLRQLQTRHPDATLKWFARGRLWNSPEEARAAWRAGRPRFPERGPDWRPGGEHRDPRLRFTRKTKTPKPTRRRTSPDAGARKRGDSGESS